MEAIGRPRLSGTSRASNSGMHEQSASTIWPSSPSGCIQAHTAQDFQGPTATRAMGLSYPLGRCVAASPLSPFAFFRSSLPAPAIRLLRMGQLCPGFRALLWALASGHSRSGLRDGVRLLLLARARNGQTAPLVAAAQHLGHVQAAKVLVGRVLVGCSS